MERMRFRQAIVAALNDEMAADPNVIVMGEDIAAAGGTFKATEGLLDIFGPSRVRDTPISEMAFTGAAVGAATQGLRPVVEIMFMEFLGVALDQLVTEAAKFRYLSNGKVSVPMVLRSSTGAGLGFGCQHSQTLENWVTATPGLKVVVPSDPESAYGLLRAAIQDPDPVAFLEPRALYATLGPVNRGEAGILPLSKARVLREGEGITFVGLGSTVTTCLQVASTLDDGVGEVIDLSTLYPWDAETVLSSVRKTGRLCVVQEAPSGGGWGHEVVSRVTSEAFGSLQAAPFVVSAPDVPVPYGAEMERHYLPSAELLSAQIGAYLTQGEIPTTWWAKEGTPA